MYCFTVNSGSVNVYISLFSVSHKMSAGKMKKTVKLLGQVNTECARGNIRQALALLLEVSLFNNLL